MDILPKVSVKTQSSSTDFEEVAPQRILVVEDDSIIRQWNSELLTANGFLVDTAEDGEDALIAVQSARHHNIYSLLIIDQDIPRLSGSMLLKKLHEERINIPIIFTVGKHQEGLLHIFPNVTILSKPFSKDQLLTAVIHNLVGNGCHTLVATG